MKLYGYWRSSASYRVRIALALKDLAYEYEPVNLLKGEQAAADYTRYNPGALVPTLVTDDGAAISQSLAIIEFVEEAFPSPSVLPQGLAERAQARAFAATLACEGQPFMNFRIQRYLKEHGFDDARMSDWLNRFPGAAMAAAEKIAKAHGGDFCIGDEPTIADCCLVPQMFAAERFGIDLDALPTLRAINARCLALEAFKRAHPKNQPDAA